MEERVNTLPDDNFFSISKFLQTIYLFNQANIIGAVIEVAENMAEK